MIEYGPKNAHVHISVD